MKKVRITRSRPSLDMTPMVDLAFLLVTFFMLTTQFAPEEPVAVDTPTSQSENVLPDTDMITISVSKEGIVYFNIDGQFTRERLLKTIAEKYNQEFNDKELHVFTLASSIGMPIGNLKQFLSMTADERKSIHQPGIPSDTIDNELADWIMYSRAANPKVRIAIKGDGDASYPTIRKVIKSLIDRRITQFHLITDLEKES